MSLYFGKLGSHNPYMAVMPPPLPPFRICPKRTAKSQSPKAASDSDSTDDSDDIDDNCDKRSDSQLQQQHQQHHFNWHWGQWQSLPPPPLPPIGTTYFRYEPKTNR